MLEQLRSALEKLEIAELHQTSAPRWPLPLSNISWEGEQKVRLNVYSDGMNLATKTSLEKRLVQESQKILPPEVSVLVYFERKEKLSKPPATAPRPAEPSAPPAAAAQQQGRAPSARRPIPGVKHIIAVGSGKGGVGKSTVSVNLALSLYNQGYKVGILDADVYGPSLPMMLGIQQDPLLDDENKIIPPEAYGLKVMSFGFFAPEDTAVIWRGPMIMKALQQFFWDVAWGSLDFLIIDLPPGTGDAQLTLVQSIPLSGAVIVTTPQNVALLDAAKGVAMFRKTEVSVLGIVENMASFTCPHCNEETPIFGVGGATRISEKFEVPVLGRVPLIPEIRIAGDLGEPLTTIPGHGVRDVFLNISQAMIQRLGQQP